VNELFYAMKLLVESFETDSFNGQDECLSAVNQYLTSFCMKKKQH